MTDSYIIFSKILGLKCQKQKHSKNIVLLWPCGHKDQSFLAFWYKSKQDIFKEVKIQMKKDNFVLNLCRCLSDSLSNSIWHCWKRFQRQIWILYLPVCPTAPMQNQVKQNHAKVSPSTTKYGQARPTTPRYHQSAQNMIFKKHLQKERKKMKTVSKVASNAISAWGD